MGIGRWIAASASVLAVASLAAAPAHAGRKSFSISVYSVHTEDSADKVAGSNGNGGLELPDSGSPSFAFGFNIPKPYKVNSQIRILFNWSTPSTSCSISLLPDFVERSRPGHAATTGSAVGGLIPEDGSTVLTAPNNASVGSLKVFTLTPSQGFDQVTGDAILLGFYRDSGATADTCADELYITGITIEYITP